MLVIIVRCREGRWKHDSQSDFTSYLARLSLNTDDADTGNSTAGRFSHPPSHSARSRGHKRSRRFRRLSNRACHGVCSLARSVWAGKLDGSSSSCPLHIRPAWSNWLIQPRLSWDWPFHLNSNGWRRLYFFCCMSFLCICNTQPCDM